MIGYCSMTLFKKERGAGHHIPESKQKSSMFHQCCETVVTPGFTGRKQKAIFQADPQKDLKSLLMWFPAFELSPCAVANFKDAS